MLPWMSPVYSRPGSLGPPVHVQTTARLDGSRETPSGSMSQARHMDIKDLPRVSRPLTESITGHHHAHAPRYPGLNQNVYSQMAASTSRDVQTRQELYKQYLHHQQQWMHSIRAQSITQAQNTRLKPDDNTRGMNMGTSPETKITKTPQPSNMMNSFMKPESRRVSSREPSRVSPIEPNVVRHRSPSASSSRSPSVPRQHSQTPPAAAPPKETCLPPLDLSVSRKRSSNSNISHSSDQPLDLSKKKRDSEDDDDVILVGVHQPGGTKNVQPNVISHYPNPARNVLQTPLPQKPHHPYHAGPSSVSASTSKRPPSNDLAWKSEQSLGYMTNSKSKYEQGPHQHMVSSNCSSRDMSGPAYQMSLNDRYRLGAAHSDKSGVTRKPNHPDTALSRSDPGRLSSARTVLNLQEQIREEQQCFRAHEKALEEKAGIHRKHLQMASRVHGHDSVLFHASREQEQRQHGLEYTSKPHMPSTREPFNRDTVIEDPSKQSSYMYREQRDIPVTNRDHVRHPDGNISCREFQVEEYKPIRHFNAYKQEAEQPKPGERVIGRTNCDESLSAQPAQCPRENEQMNSTAQCTSGRAIDKHTVPYSAAYKAQTLMHNSNAYRPQVSRDVLVPHDRRMITPNHGNSADYQLRASDGVDDVNRQYARNIGSDAFQHGALKRREDVVERTNKSQPPSAPVNWYEKVEAYKDCRSRIGDSNNLTSKCVEDVKTTMTVDEKSHQSSVGVTGGPVLESPAEASLKSEKPSELSEDNKSPHMVAKNESKFLESKPSKFIPVANVHPIVHSKKEEQPLQSEERGGPSGSQEDRQPMDSKKTSPASPNTCVMEIFKHTLDEAPQKIQITPNPLYSNHQGEFVRFISQADSNAQAVDAQKVKRTDTKTRSDLTVAKQNRNKSAYQTPETADSINLAENDPTNKLPKVCRNLSLHFTTPKGRHKLLAKHSSSVPMDAPLSSATELVSFHPPVQNPNRPKVKRKRPPKSTTNDESNEGGAKKRKIVKKQPKVKDTKTAKHVPKNKKCAADGTRISPEDTKKKIKCKTYHTRNKPIKPGARISGRSSSSLYDKNAAYEAELRKEEERKKLRRVRRKISPLEQRTSSTEDSLDLTVTDSKSTTLEEESQDQPQLDKSDSPLVDGSAQVADESATPVKETETKIPTGTDGSEAPVRVKRKYTRRVPLKNAKIPKKMLKKESGTAKRITKKVTAHAPGEPAETETVVEKPKKRQYIRKKPLVKKSATGSKETSDDQTKPRVKRAYRKRKDKVMLLNAEDEGGRASQAIVQTVDTEEQTLGLHVHDDSVPLLPIAPKPKGRRYPMQRVRRRRREVRAEVGAEAALDKKRLFICREIGETALHKAARKGYVEAALQCLSSPDVDVNVRDNAGYTPLHESCVSGNLTIARALIDRGADPNAKSLHGGTRPIHDAVDNNHLELVRLLLSHGADPTIANYAGKTPLKMARSTAMKNFLNDYFCDVRDEPVEIEIPGFLGKQGCELGFDILEGAPADVDTDAGGCVFFDMSAELKPPTLCLQLDKQAGHKNYHLVDDVSRMLGVDNPDDFILLNGDLKFGNLAKSDAIGQLRTSQLGHLTHDVIHLVENQDGESINLVEIDEVLCQLLEVTREVISQKDFALEQWFLGKSYSRRLGVESSADRAPTSPTKKCSQDEKTDPATAAAPVKVNGKKYQVAVMVAAEPERYESDAKNDQRNIFKVATDEVRRNQGLLETSTRGTETHASESNEPNPQNQRIPSEPIILLRRSKSCTSLKALLPPRKYESPDLIRSSSMSDVCAVGKLGQTGHSWTPAIGPHASHREAPGFDGSMDRSPHGGKSSRYSQIQDNGMEIPKFRPAGNVATADGEDSVSLSKEQKLECKADEKFFETVKNSNMPRPQKNASTCTTENADAPSSTKPNLPTNLLSDGTSPPGLDCNGEDLKDVFPPSATNTDPSNSPEALPHGHNTPAPPTNSEPALPVLEEHTKTTRPSVGEAACVEEDREMPELTLCAYMY